MYELVEVRIPEIQEFDFRGLDDTLDERLLAKLLTGKIEDFEVQFFRNVKPANQYGTPGILFDMWSPWYGYSYPKNEHTWENVYWDGAGVEHVVRFFIEEEPF